MAAGRHGRSQAVGTPSGARRCSADGKIALGLQSQTSVRQAASESNFFLGLNSFISNENVINLLPDYEALGTTLGLRLNAFNPDSVVFLTPNEIPDTTRIMIAAAKSKINSALSPPANTTISQSGDRPAASTNAS